MTNKNQQHKKGRLKAKQRAFLAVYSEAGNISQAAELANVNRCMHYTWMEKSEVYREAFEEAMEKAADRLEQEARRRAVNGVSEPVFYKGEQCGTIQRYSDTLLIFLLKGVRPEKYRERFGHEITGKDGGPIEMRKYGKLSNEELDRILAERLAEVQKD
ncbi:MAG: hypothetical protein ACOYCB_09950 [Fastidiosipilaceae bacterium]|jgi:uncharacterized protein YbjQ (UPF0145 family)